MAFTISNWTCVSSSLSQGQQTIVPFGGSSTIENAPNIFMYGSNTDNYSTISGANYFLPQYSSLNVGDWILGFGTDTSISLQVTAVSSSSVTTETTGLINSVGTANIINNAVTYAKIQQTVGGLVLIGNSSGSPGNLRELTLGPGLVFSGSVLRVDPSLQFFVNGSITLTNFLNNYTTPVLLVPAVGPNSTIIIDSIQIYQHYGTAPLVGGGALIPQYGNTIHGNGVPAGTSVTAADLAQTASTAYTMIGASGSGAFFPRSTCVNQGIYLSNKTGLFTGGTGSVFGFTVLYHTIITGP